MSREQNTALHKFDEVVNRLDQATGEDRVIRELGLSYVEEPVYQGENVILHLSVECTRPRLPASIRSRCSRTSETSRFPASA